MPIKILTADVVGDTLELNEEDLATTPLASVPESSTADTVVVITDGVPRQTPVSDLLGDVNEAIQAVADERPIVSVSVSEQITRQVLINALNANNSLIPSGKEVSLIITGINGQIAYLSVFKTNDNYGEAVGLSYYSTNKFKLENGTWAYEAFGSVGRLAVNVSGLAIDISDGHGWYYSNEVTINLPTGAVPISASWYGIFDAGSFPQIRDNAKIIFQAGRSMTLGTSRTVIVGYYIP